MQDNQYYTIFQIQIYGQLHVNVVVNHQAIPKARMVQKRYGIEEDYRDGK